MEEILHQLIGSLSQFLQGFLHPRWCRISSINSSTWRWMVWKWMVEILVFLLGLRPVFTCQVKLVSREGKSGQTILIQIFQPWKGKTTHPPYDMGEFSTPGGNYTYWWMYYGEKCFLGNDLLATGELTCWKIGSWSHKWKIRGWWFQPIWKVLVKIGSFP